jgi:DNA (cytosine-5)-methyltransferase 1
MIFGSVCSGIEAASAAWEPLGWKSAFFSEFEAFPSAVLAHHYPETPNYGDMTKFKEWPDHAINLLVGGTPCQSFSVAGLRKGMDDPRGNLALTYLAIADKYRPRWLVWENVPGVLSSNGGRDFGSFLGALGQLGYGFAYRVLDAQYFGVAQRRRRVFVVGYLGDWRRAAAVLFERESLSGHPAPCRSAREDVAAGAEDCAATVGSLCARTGRSISAQDAQQGHMVPIAFEANMSLQSPSTNNVAPTLTRRTHAAVTTKSTVRRLTPRECERLQGFSDDYTLTPHRGKPAADGPRYKALGNSMAVPVMRWIGERIAMVDKL